ncbi:dihydrofolate reductase family protein [Ruegeria sp. 2205SS24-7]|uniref:dihydrofolate reductase family protein n=1 Tax=Ruegeria discodermiae TaxID=3064389 RepID=UPI002740D02A|nr:dihydrofolate reductase family protein [Ruegeria sp. 2205SS24-7]MDP5218804.1 dihydrofolate reductase family protein [Ruegeria sp. 2205SS24-7]
MRQLAVLTFVTLDGVMQSPSMPEEDPSGGFEHGGWAAPYWEGVMDQVERHAMSDPYDMVFGRKAYDLFAGHWPNAPKSALSDRINKARKYVVTSQPSSLHWQNARPINGNIAEEISTLKAQDGPLLQVHGSSRLIQALLAHRLIDEFRLWVFPVVVGGGKRLFENGSPPCQLKLIRFEHCGNGVTMQFYRPESDASLPAQQP